MAAAQPDAAHQPPTGPSSAPAASTALVASPSIKSPEAQSARIRTDSLSVHVSFSSIQPDKFCAFIDVGVTSEQGHRKTMEDQHQFTYLGESQEPIVPPVHRIPFFGVYDGHGGTQCAEFLRDHLHRYVLQHPLLLSQPEVAISESILRAENEFIEKCRSEKIESGSTAAIALILNDRLVTANVGDSEIVLSRNGHAELLSTKHHLSCNAAEVERVKAVGGRIFHSRVGHPKFNPQLVSLAVSRAIGDAGFKLDEYTDGKASGIIAQADTKTIQLQPTDEFLIIGCDGLWDVMSHQDAVDFCAQLASTGSSSQDISRSIVGEALRLGSTDNVTVMFINLHPCAPGADTAPLVPQSAAAASGDAGVVATAPAAVVP